jgi:hypothetical protein
MVWRKDPQTIKIQMGSIINGLGLGYFAFKVDQDWQ